MDIRMLKIIVGSLFHFNYFVWCTDCLSSLAGLRVVVLISAEFNRDQVNSDASNGFHSSAFTKVCSVPKSRGDIYTQRTQTVL